MFVKNIGKFSLGLFLVVAGCVKDARNSVQSARVSNSPRIVIAQCAAPQGNGGNWGSTLAWASEQIFVRAEQADQLTKKTGQTHGLYLGCMLGGSSGSVVTNVVMRILQNKNLVPGASTERIYTADEARIFARAVRYMSMAADLSLDELARMVVQLALVKADIPLSKTQIGQMIEELFGAKHPRWWDGQKVLGNIMLIDFATLLNLAETIKPEMLNVPVSSFLDKRLAAVAVNHGMASITDFAKFSRLEDVPTGDTAAKDLSQILEFQARTINHNSDGFIASHFKVGGYQARHFVDVSRKGDASSPLKKTLDTPLAPGFCTSTMAAVLASPDEVPQNKAPDYSTLRPVVFCSKETVDIILRSPLYRKHLQDKNSFASRFVLATVNTSRGAITPSIREPDLMPELAGLATEGGFEVEELYAPDFDRGVHGALTFQLLPARGFSVGGKPFQPTFAVAGGFADRRIFAWMLSYYALAKMEEMTAKGIKVIGRVGIFGKPDNRGVDKFDTKSIRTFFSASPAAGQANVQDWFNFQDAWCDTFSPEFERYNGKIETVAFNWDVNTVPAAQFYSSRLVAVKAVNATRQQLSMYEENSFPGVVFDPSVTSNHVPRLSEPYACKPR